MKQFIGLVLLLLNQSCVTKETTTYIAFSSCNDPENSLAVLPALSEALDTIPTFVWLGDNVYLKDGEWDNLDRIRDRYKVSFQPELIQEILSKGTHFAIWDDHDAGPNDCDASFAGMDKTMLVFKEFWKPSYPMPNDKSYYGSVALEEGQVELFFLDNRSFRVHHDSSGATVFGEVQLKWLESAYKRSDALFKIILMGGQFLNTAQVFDNVSRFPNERNRLIDLMVNDSAVPIVLSGDRHHGELNTLDSYGKLIFETTASPLTSRNFAHHEEENLTRLHPGTTETNHFGVLGLTRIGDSITGVKMSLIGEGGTVLFSSRETNFK